MEEKKEKEFLKWRLEESLKHRQSSEPSSPVSLPGLELTQNEYTFLNDQWPITKNVACGRWQVPGGLFQPPSFTDEELQPE